MWFFSPQEQPLSELSYDMKIFSKLLTQGYALKKINGVDENTVREKICVESLAKYSHFFGILPVLRFGFV